MVPSLAQDLRDARDLETVAHGREAAARERVLRFIEHLFPGWRRRFPPWLCWRWTESDGTGPEEIDVWGLPSTERDLEVAARALHLAGFAGVRVHPHAIERAASCTCPTRTPA